MKAFKVQKIEIKASSQDKKALDDTSKLCCRLYNYLLNYCKSYYLSNNKSNDILKAYQLTYRLKDIKDSIPILKGVYSLLLDNVSYRARKALLAIPEYNRYDNINYHNWDNNWFSLQYSKSNIGYKVENNKLQISLSNQKKITLTLLEKKEKFKPVYLEITKQHNRYFAIFCRRIDVPDKLPQSKIKNWIAIDQNHENFFVAIDSSGQSLRINRLQSESYFNQQIDDLVDKIKACTSIKRKTILYKSLNKITNKRKEQTDTALHAIAKKLAIKYDLVLIGDYVPRKEDIPFENMKKVMIDRTHIAYFRKILEWDMKKKGKTFKLVNERNTTQKCCICGLEEYRNPHQRNFQCKETGKFIIRDLNSCINIARKGGIIINNPIVDKITNTYRFDFKKSKLVEL